MPSKRIIINLENEEGTHAEAILTVSNDIGDELNDAPMLRNMLDELFELTSYKLINVEVAEEIRHEMKREIWTEEQRKAYRERIRANNR